MKKAMFICLLLACIAAFSIWEQDESGYKIVPKQDVPQQQAEAVEVTAMPKPQEAFAQSFEYFSIDQEVESRIRGVSWKQGSAIDLEDLRYVKVAYWGFDDMPHMGELIVNRSVAKDITEIFEELYKAKFPIDKIRLIDDYDAKDNESMADNNTSAFCYREVDGKPGQLSKHSYGIAIDINPVQNPYVYKGKVSPLEGKKYVDRSKPSKGMVIKNDLCYKAFTSRGWTWGGDWKYEKDYQHFQKKQ